MTDLLENIKLLRKKDKVKFVSSHLVAFSARTSWSTFVFSYSLDKYTVQILLVPLVIQNDPGNLQ